MIQTCWTGGSGRAWYKSLAHVGQPGFLLTFAGTIMLHVRLNLSMQTHVASWMRRTSRQWWCFKHASLGGLNHLCQVRVRSKGAVHQGQIGLVSAMLLRLIEKALDILLVGDKEFGLFPVAIGQGGIVRIHRPLTVGSHVNQGGMMNHTKRGRGGLLFVVLLVVLLDIIAVVLAYCYSNAQRQTSLLRRRLLPPQGRRIRMLSLVLHVKFHVPSDNVYRRTMWTDTGGCAQDGMPWSQS